jgi:hypothetical protein
MTSAYAEPLIFPGRQAVVSRLFTEAYGEFFEIVGHGS